MSTRVVQNLTYIFAVFLIACFSETLFAESNAANGNSPTLSLCDGVWTTKSCEKPEKSLLGVDRAVREKVENNTVEPKVVEKTEMKGPENQNDSHASDPKYRNLEDKKEGLNSLSQTTNTSKSKMKDAEEIPDSKVIASTLHPLVMKALSIREQFSKDFDYSQVERYCNSKNLELEDCEVKVSESLEKARAYEIKLQELALEEKQLETELAKNQPKLEQNNVTITQFTSTNIRNRNVNNQPGVKLKNTHPGLGRHSNIVVRRPNKDVSRTVESSIDHSAVLRK